MFHSRLEELYKVIEHSSYRKGEEELSPEEGLREAQALLAKVSKDKGIVYVIGNGGSAGIASHFCTDLLKAVEVPATTLTDPGVMSCISNDIGYEHVYSFPLKRNLRDKDLLVAISSSGQSPNILHAVKVAKEKRVPLMTLSGFAHDNPLRASGSLNFWVDSNDYGLVEMAHFFLLHTLIDSIAFAYAR